MTDSTQPEDLSPFLEAMNDQELESRLQCLSEMKAAAPWRKELIEAWHEAKLEVAARGMER